MWPRERHEPVDCFFDVVDRVDRVDGCDVVQLLIAMMYAVKHGI